MSVCKVIAVCSKSMVKLKIDQKRLDDQVGNLLVKNNGDASRQVAQQMSQLGLKLPLNPKKIKSGPKGEVIVQKGLDEQWTGEYAGYYLYGGLHGARAMTKEGNPI